MKILSETPSRDLSGEALDVDGVDILTVISARDYLVSSLSPGIMTTAYFQAEGDKLRDIDSFVMHLDAGDIYQIVFSSPDVTPFLGARSMDLFGANGDFMGRILAQAGDTFSAVGTQTSYAFAAPQSGDYLLVAQFEAQSRPVTASYGLTLEKIADVTPWNVALSRDGIGAKAILSSPDQKIAAGSEVIISLTFATANVTYDEVRMLVDGGMSSLRSSSADETSFTITITPAHATRLQDLLEFSFDGGKNGGRLSVSHVAVELDGTSVIADTGPDIRTIGNLHRYGTAGSDRLQGNLGDDRLWGRGGDDHLLGRAGQDRLDGGAGADRMAGGGGNDLYRVDNTRDLVVEALHQGMDQVQSTVSYGLRANVEHLELLGGRNLAGSGNALANTLTGNAGNNLLRGLAGKDVLSGGDGKDVLKGGTGNDVLRGGVGNDRLIGGSGADHLTGGAGADSFVFTALSDSTTRLTGQDRITDFRPGQHDLIDLVAIDANATRHGNQAFHYLGDAAFTGHAGELSARAMAMGTLVMGDVDGDRRADFAILLEERQSPGADAFLL